LENRTRFDQVEKAGMRPLRPLSEAQHSAKAANRQIIMFSGQRT
jgi:hypothetical protein